jgi:hypothetical protein
MAKQWLSLLALGFIICGVAVAWDVFLTLNNLKGDFFYTIVPIESGLYESVDSHFRANPEFQLYEENAKKIEAVDAFK